MRTRVRSRKDGLIRLPSGARVSAWLSPEPASKPEPAPNPPAPAPSKPEPSKPEPAPNPPAPAPSKPDDDYEYLRSTDICAFSTEAQRRFVLFCAEFISSRGGTVSAASLIRASAFHCNLSTETTKRYLSKYSAPLPDTPFVWLGDLVSLRRA